MDLDVLSSRAVSNRSRSRTSYGDTLVSVLSIRRNLKTNSEIVEYVTCKTCRSPDTELNKGENRLYFVTCNSCGSRRSVTAIKTGFSAQVGKRKRQQG